MPLPLLTRRALLRSAAAPAAAAAAALAAGCGPAAGGRKIVRFWNGFTGPDGRTMLRLVQRFNDANPGVQVVMQRMDWATYYNKLFVAGLGGRAPELFVLQTHSIPRFAQASFVRPIDDLASAPGSLAIDDIDANVWQAVSVAGRHYGVPLDVWPMGMYYNRRRFREAGIVDARGEPKPPRDRAGFMDAIHRLTRPPAGGREAQWGFVFTNFESNVYTLMQQFGGEFFTPDNERCIVNHPRCVEALQFCVDVIRKDRCAPPPENFDAWIGFRQGKAAMAFEGIYMLADLQKQKDLDFSGAPVPMIGERQAVWAGSHNVCMRADLAGSDLEAAWRFTKFLSDNSLDWAEGGQVPVRKSLRSTPRFAGMTVQSQFAREIPYAVYLPRLPYIFEFQTEFNTAIEKALRASATPQQALDTAAANVDQIIQRQKQNGQAISSAVGQRRASTSRATHPPAAAPGDSQGPADAGAGQTRRGLALAGITGCTHGRLGSGGETRGRLANADVGEARGGLARAGSAGASSGSPAAGGVAGAAPGGYTAGAQAASAQRPGRPV